MNWLIAVKCPERSESAMRSISVGVWILAYNNVYI